MACPNCGCKVTYQYDNDDDICLGDDSLERCAACGCIFDIEELIDDEDCDYKQNFTMTKNIQ